MIKRIGVAGWFGSIRYHAADEMRFGGTLCGEIPEGKRVHYCSDEATLTNVDCWTCRDVLMRSMVQVAVNEIYALREKVARLENDMRMQHDSLGLIIRRIGGYDMQRISETMEQLVKSLSPAKRKALGLG